MQQINETEAKNNNKILRAHTHIRRMKKKKTNQKWIRETFWVKEEEWKRREAKKTMSITVWLVELLTSTAKHSMGFKMPIFKTIFSYFFWTENCVSVLCVFSLVVAGVEATAAGAHFQKLSDSYQSHNHIHIHLTIADRELVSKTKAPFERLNSKHKIENRSE